MTKLDDIVGALYRLSSIARTPEDEQAVELLAKTIFTHSRTGHPSTYALERDIKQMQEQRKQTGELKPYLGVVDIDKFKKFNDALGYAEGDRAIKQVLSIVHETVQDNLRFYDIPDPLERASSAYHEHGEEFPVFVFARNDEEARNIFERVRMAVKARCRRELRDIIERAGTNITVSIGYTKWDFGSETLEEASARRDRYKSMAKYAGRNCVMGDGHEIHVSDTELAAFEREETERRY